MTKLSGRIIIGTAGHVDHGKTQLTRALTGVDTDRLPAEKNRGITIELGFAPWRLTPELTADIIDVPGHEKFVRTMTAGVAAVDLALLLVAADEGVMPQTVEHFQILRLLGVRRCIFVISKADKATPEAVDKLVAELRRRTAATPYASSPIIAVSSACGSGLTELTEEVKRQAAAIISERRNNAVANHNTDLQPKSANTNKQNNTAKVNNAVESHNNNLQPQIANSKRLPVDRVFSVKGFGTVVTGTLWGGVLAVGDTVEVQPLGRLAKIRRLEVNGEAVERCGGSCRVAVNLPDLAKSDIPRGSWLAEPHLLSAAHTIGARLTLLPAAPRLKNNAPVHIRFGAREVNGRIRFDGDCLPLVAENAEVRIYPEQPIFPLAGDRMIIASYSPVTTIGGAVVTAVNPPKRRKKAAQTERRLEDFLQGYHTAHPADYGVTLSKLRAKLFPAGGAADSAKLTKAVESLLAQGKLQKRGAYFALADFQPQIDAKTEKLLTATLEKLTTGGFAPPTPESLLRHTSPAKAKEIMERLAAEGKIVKLGEVVFAAAAFEQAQTMILAYLRRHGSISLAETRDLLQTSRKFALPILTRMDSLQLTRRQGDVRVMKNK